MAYCNGVCARYRSSTLEESRLRYAFGNKWCCYCSVFIKWNGRDCPCCRTRLRTRPVRKSLQKPTSLATNAKAEIDRI